MAYIQISDLLKPTKTAAIADQATFNRWMIGKITTAEAIAEFMINNDIARIEIDPEQFEQWVNGLGYRRVKYE